MTGSSLYAKIRGIALRLKQALTPPAPAWTGAATAVYLIGALAMLALFVTVIVPDFSWQRLPAYVAVIGALILAGLAVLAVAALVMHLPRRYRYALAFAAPFMVAAVFPGKPIWNIAAAAALILIVSLIGGSLAVLRRSATARLRRSRSIGILAIALAGLIAGAYAVFSDKGPANPALADFVLENRTLDLPNPGLPGPHAVRSLTYGSGKDRWRDAYGAGVDLVTRTVDGSKFIGNWAGLSGWLRTSYWGFDVTALPLQARVWYPDGDGPFPVVLIVHGNHAMEDYSDPGYAYLGELLASRGIITASVDQNFINSAISSYVQFWKDRPGLEEENDARAWLLLEHLKLWRDWNQEAGHPFQGNVDMDRVALIGHSRGGEAVGIAAAFNALDRYPDDASVDFDYGFNLRGVIAIAPVYGQYEPRERPTPIRNVDYFTIHGDLDGDVQSFEGMGQYSRTTFDDDDYHFRAGLYVIGANHGQFNTTWGDTDTWAFDAWALDRDRIMDGEAQREVARVYFSAFLEIVLHGRREYLPMFRDPRHAASWLPQTFYIPRFSDTQDTVLADFEEDIDPATMSVPGGRIATRHVSRWYETGNALKWDELDTHSAVVAWDRRFSDDVARLDFDFPAMPAGQLLVASLAAIEIDTLPDDWQEADSASEQEEADEVLDWTVELADAAGRSASVPLSHDAPLYPLVRAVPRRARFLEAEDDTEVLFRRFELPVADFMARNPELDAASITRVSFVFDRSAEGAIIVDDLSFSTTP